jgi:hypothetical protein
MFAVLEKCPRPGVRSHRSRMYISTDKTFLVVINYDSLLFRNGHSWVYCIFFAAHMAAFCKVSSESSCTWTKPPLIGCTFAGICYVYLSYLAVEPRLLSYRHPTRAGAPYIQQARHKHYWPPPGPPETSIKLRLPSLGPMYVHGACQVGRVRSAGQ